MRVNAVKSLAFVLGIGLAAGIGAENISYRQAADMLYLVMSADRTAYTRKVVQRLARDEEVITASEHYEDDSALPLPAQMFRFGAELVADATEDFSYSLLSLHPINKKNGPARTRSRKGCNTSPTAQAKTTTARSSWAASAISLPSIPIRRSRKRAYTATTTTRIRHARMPRSAT